MKFDESTYRIIEEYLKGDLSELETKAFEARLSNEKELAQEVEHLKIAKSAVILDEMHLLHEQIGHDIDQIDAKRKLNKTFWMISIATVCVTVTSLLFWINSKNTSINEDTSQVQPDLIKKSKTSTTPVITSPHSKEKNIQESTENQRPEHSAPNSSQTSENTDNVNTMSDTQNVETNLIAVEINKETEIVEKDHSTSLGLKNDTEKKTTPTCPELSLKVPIQIIPRSKDEINGQIKILSHQIDIGQRPYTFKILEIDDEFSSTIQYEELETGKYTLEVQDDNNCLVARHKNIVIKQTICFTNYPKNFIPKYDGEWVLPIDDEQDAKIILKDKGQNTIWEASLNGEDEFRWNGISKNGNVVNSSYIWFTLTYENGSTCTGGFNLGR